MFGLRGVLLTLAVAAGSSMIALSALHAQPSQNRPEMPTQYLIAVSQVLERGYQQAQRYPSLVVADFPDLSTDRSINVGVVRTPAFRFSLHSSPQAYTLTAAALNGLQCTLTLNQSGKRTMYGTDCGGLHW